MIGAIMGDIVGSRFEFRNAKTTDFELMGRECSYTDDTICTIAIADAILNGYAYADSIRCWANRYSNPMGGYGMSFRHWLQSPDAPAYNSYGNGAAMRVSPVGWLFNTEQDVLFESEKTAIVSHNHPEGIKGAQTIALCIFKLRMGASKEEIQEYSESQYGLLPKYKPFSNPFDETSMNAVPVSIACFLASEDFEDAVRKAIIVGGDSDTIGAITGGLAEAYYKIPNELIKKAYGYLPDDMRIIIKQFNNYIYAR